MPAQRWGFDAFAVAYAGGHHAKDASCGQRSFYVELVVAAKPDATVAHLHHSMQDEDT